MKIIKVEDETHQELMDWGNKGETFDDLIKRLLYEAKEGK